ncbi:Putative LOC101896609, partial [Caligus rogercresseyi]
EANDPESMGVLKILESIDDDCDANNILMVKIDNSLTAQKYGIKAFPSLLYFEDNVPFVYTGNLTNEDEVIGWILHQQKSDEIEEVNVDILNLLLLENDIVASLFYDKSDRQSKKILAKIENIDDELDAKSVVFVKISTSDEDTTISSQFGIEY